MTSLQDGVPFLDLRHPHRRILRDVDAPLRTCSTKDPLLGVPT